jgi:hypothetical protein
MKYYCEVCNKSYSTKNSLWNHKKNYHEGSKANKSINKKVSLSCLYCNKTFANKSNMNRHKKNCKELPELEVVEPVHKNSLGVDLDNVVEKVVDVSKVAINNNKTDSILNFLLENNSLLQPQNQIHGNDNNMPNDSYNPITNSHNSTNNSHNTTNNTTNNNITISLGNENLSDVLSLQEQVNILKQKNEALEEMIKYVHFNKKYPQFHNIAMDENTGYIYDAMSQKFIQIPKEELMIDLIENRMNDICEFNDDNKMRLSTKNYEHIKSYVNMFNINQYVNKKMENIEPIIYTGTQKLLNGKRIKI